LQLFVLNEEFLVFASHQLAKNTSLAFVHTARRILRTKKKPGRKEKEEEGRGRGKKTARTKKKAATDLTATDSYVGSHGNARNAPELDQDPPERSPIGPFFTPAQQPVDSRNTAERDLAA